MTDLCDRIQALRIVDPNTAVVPPVKSSELSHAASATASEPRPSGIPQHMVSDDDFERLEILGRGSFSTVYKVIHNSSGKHFALKCIPRRLIASKQLERQVRQEINVHRLLRHPNIVRLYTYYITAGELCIVMELCSGTLQRKLNAHGGRFDEARAARYTRQIARALLHLHEHHLCHRDLKLENLLLDSQGVLRVADFGWVADLPKSEPKRDVSVEGEEEEGRKTFCGTLDYLPPEMVRRQGSLPSADVWSLGVIIAEMLTGTAPFYAKGYRETLDRICHDEPSLPADTLSEECRQLLLSMLQKDPLRRPTVAEVLSHPWTSLDKRIAAEQQQQHLRQQQQQQSRAATPV